MLCWQRNRWSVTLRQAQAARAQVRAVNKMAQVQVMEAGAIASVPVQVASRAERHPLLQVRAPVRAASRAERHPLLQVRAPVRAASRAQRHPLRVLAPVQAVSRAPAQRFLLRALVPVLVPVLDLVPVLALVPVPVRALALVPALGVQAPAVARRYRPRKNRLVIAIIHHKIAMKNVLPIAPGRIRSSMRLDRFNSRKRTCTQMVSVWVGGISAVMRTY